VSSGTLSTTGRGGEGVYARSTDGAINVRHVGNIVTTGDVAKGIRAWGKTNVAVNTVGRVQTGGYGSSGILVASDNGTGAVTISGSVATTGHDSPAVKIDSRAGATLRNNGTITTSGVRSTGAKLHSTQGTALVANNGRITASGPAAVAIEALAAGQVAIDNRGTVSTTGAEADAVRAVSTTGAVIIANDAGSISTTGNLSDGIDARARQNIAIRTARAVTASGVDSRAIVAGSTIGRSVVHVQSRASAVGGSGTGAAVEFVDGPLGNVLNNEGLVYAASGLAVRGGSHAETIVNAGEMRGRLDLGAGDDVLRNNGLFVFSGDSDFGNGIDRIDNRGRFNVGAGSSPTTVRLLGLESFNNLAGARLSLANNVRGDRLELGGAYAGSGGVVAVDASATTADVLAIAGAVTGHTNVEVSYLRGGAISASGLALIDVSSGTTTAGDFALANGPIVDGLLSYDLALQNDNVWRLVGSASSSAQTLMRYSAAGSTSWQTTGQAFDHYAAAFTGSSVSGLERSALTASRFSEDGAGDTGGTGSVGTWFALVDGGKAATGHLSGGSGRGPNLQASGFQAGADMVVASGARHGAGDLIVGFTYGASNFADSRVSAPEEDAPNNRNAGAYLMYRTGGLTATLLAKQDQLDVLYGDIGLDHSELSFSTAGVKAALGYLIAGDEQGPWSLKGHASLSRTRTAIEAAEFNGVPVAFTDQHVLSAEAGLSLALNQKLGSSRGSDAVGVVFGAAVTTDFARGQEMRILDYQPIVASEAGTSLAFSGAAMLRLGGLTASTELGYRLGVDGEVSGEVDVHGGVRAKLDF
ncbi:MAG: hypothetical protein ACK4MF_00810, partial [Hyphomicrobiaceae bacterium]